MTPLDERVAFLTELAELMNKYDVYSIDAERQSNHDTVEVDFNNGGYVRISGDETNYAHPLDILAAAGKERRGT